MGIAIIVQARMTSTRLPGKVLKTVMGKPLLEYLVERLRKVKLADKIIIATTINNTDEPIVELCKKLDVLCFRGSEGNVLSRYFYAAGMYNAHTVVRITSDCPLIDPNVVDNIIGFYLRNKKRYDYVSNTLKRTFPRGMDVEVFDFKLLSEAFNETDLSYDCEHVTPFIYRQPQRYRVHNISYIQDKSFYRWTVDTKEDFELIEVILNSIYPTKPDFTLEDLLELLEKNPQWLKINSHIEQKH